MKICFSDAAKKDFSGISPSDQVRIREKTKLLVNWPDVSGWKPLRREWIGHGRLRSGDWRIIFRIPLPDDLVLWVVRIGHRSEIYEG